MQDVQKESGSPGEGIVSGRGYLLAAVLLFVTEVLIALFAKDRFIRPFAGDFLVVILLYCIVRSIVRAPVMLTVIVVLLFAYLFEGLQYFGLVYRLGLGDWKLAQVVIGTTFEWGDLIAYTLGILLVVAVERWRGVS
jgi:hypothetical protein